MLPINNPRMIDPALLTSEEYLQIVDPDRKTHPNDSYSWTVENMNSDGRQEKTSDYPKLLRRIKLSGLNIEIRLKSELKKFCKIGPDGEYLRIDGQLQHYSPEEVTRMGFRGYYYTVAAFSDDMKIGTVQDEWGCVLVSVAEEYRGIGLGTILQKLARTMEPDKPSGGFTPAGLAGFLRVHREFVRDALKDNVYLRLVKAGQLSLERVREIVGSAHVNLRSKPSTKNLSTTNQKDWLLHVSSHGTFVLYDRKIRELYDDETMDHFCWKMILGAANITINKRLNGEDIGVLMLFGGDTLKIKQLMIKLALSYAARENVPLYLEENELPFIANFAETVGKLDNRTGFRRQLVRLTQPPLDYEKMGMADKIFRKSFDRYGEFATRILEYGHGKFSL